MEERAPHKRKEGSSRLHYAAHERLVLAALLSAVSVLLRVVETIPRNHDHWRR